MQIYHNQNDLNVNINHNNPHNHSQTQKISGTGHFNRLPDELIMLILDILTVNEMRPLLLTDKRTGSLTQTCLQERVKKYLTEDEAKVFFQKPLSLMQKFLEKISSLWIPSPEKFQSNHLNINSLSSSHAEKLKKFLFDENYLKTIDLLIAKKTLNNIPFLNKISDDGTINRSTQYDLVNAYISQNNILMALYTASKIEATTVEVTLDLMVRLTEINQELKRLTSDYAPVYISDALTAYANIRAAITCESDLDAFKHAVELERTVNPRCGPVLQIILKKEIPAEKIPKQKKSKF